MSDRKPFAAIAVPAAAGTWHRRLPILIILVVALAGFVAFRDELSFQALSAREESLEAFRDRNFALAALTFMAAYALIVAFSLPGATVATLTGGFLFGLFPGALFNVIAATLGAIAIFTAARAGFADALARRIDHAGPRIRRLQEALRENEWSVLFLMRFLPIVPFFVANLIPAILGVSTFRFAVSTFFGIMPGALVFTSLGAGLGEVFDRGASPDLSLITEPYILLPILGLAFLSVLPVLVKYWRGKVL
jgi:uncharacterized membrane protein YdjX (TVP38/TMEM64 family)